MHSSALISCNLITLMLEAQPAGGYGWFPTCTGFLLFLTVHGDARLGAAMWVLGGKSLNVGNALEKSVVEKENQQKLRGGNGKGPFCQSAVLL